MYDSDADRLFEELTLHKTVEEACMPQFNCFTHRDSRYWNYWGSSFIVPKQWNPKNKHVICYRNKDGLLHRQYGPAFINELYNEEAWFFEGKLHREGNWAYRKKGNFIWMKHGVLHNLEGPAVVESAGPYQFWIDGIRYSRKQYKWEMQRRIKKTLKPQR